MTPFGKSGLAICGLAASSMGSYWLYDSLLGSWTPIYGTNNKNVNAREGEEFYKTSDINNSYQSIFLSSILVSSNKIHLETDTKAKNKSLLIIEPKQTEIFVINKEHSSL